MSLSANELNELRDVRIHKLLGLRDDGRRLMVRCPFHRDGTASFLLDSENGYYCFGCNKSGKGAIDFCMELGSTFGEACNELKGHV